MDMKIGLWDFSNGLDVCLWILLVAAVVGVAVDIIQIFIKKKRGY